MKHVRFIAAVLVAGGMFALGIWMVRNVSGQAADPASAAPDGSVPSAVAAGPVAPPAISPESGAIESGAVIESGPIELKMNGDMSDKGLDVIDLDLKDAELMDVVNLFMTVTKKNIILATNLPPSRVTLHLSGVDWKNALTTILEQKGFTLEDKTGSGMYTITVKSSVDPLVTETIFLKYADVPAVKTVLATALMDRGKIAEFPSRSAMIITTTLQNLTDLKKIIDQIDIPRKQVFIEAKFMELTASAIKNTGIDWTMLKAYQVGGSARLLEQSEEVSSAQVRTLTLTKNDARQNVDNFGRPGEGNSYVVNGSTLTPAGTLTRGIGESIQQGINAGDQVGNSSTRTFSDIRGAVLNPLTFNLVLSALKAQDGISILSNPKIMVSNGEQAEILVGEQRRVFNSSLTAPTPSSGPIVSYSPGDSIDFGVKLKVTPTVHTDNNITVKIEPELSRYAGEITAPNGQTYPIKQTKTVKTEFCLEDGKTAAIGGLTETQDEKADKGIPILGDIPLIGKYLFSSSSDKRDQKETIIFVTVGIANMSDIEKETGLPSDARYAREELVKERERNAKFNNDLAKMEDAARKRTEKADKRQRVLLNRSR